MVKMGSLSTVNMNKAGMIYQRVEVAFGTDISEMNLFTSQLPLAEGRSGVGMAINIILVDGHTLQVLEQLHVINYWRGASKLIPVQTTGDGNCLLHAVSRSMWGVQDKLLILRKRLDHAMQRDGGVLKQRWACKRRASDAAVGLFIDDPEQWDREWRKMIKMASATPNAEVVNQTRYAPLEEFHIFVLAHILYRPIVVLADVTFRDLSPNPFVGIYLPLLRRPEECVRSPIVIAYNDQHFTPLFTTQSCSQNGISTANASPLHTIPLVRLRRNKMNLPVPDNLPIPYVLPHEQGRDLLNEYLNIVHLQDNGNDMLPAAQLEVVPLPDELNLFTDFVNFDWEASLNEIPQPTKVTTSAIASSEKPFGIVRPRTQAIGLGNRSPTESLPIACTEREDGPGASESPQERSYLRQKLQQDGYTATVVNPSHPMIPSSATSLPPFPDQENVATGPHGEPVNVLQQTLANVHISPTGITAIQPGTPSPGEECSPPNRDVSSSSAPSSQTYAAAVKSRPGPQKQPRIPKPFSTRTYKPNCKTEHCKGSPSRQNGGYCIKCQRQNSAEERKRRMRERTSSLQGNNTRPDTPVKIGRSVNKKRGGQPTKPKLQRPQTASAPSPSLVQPKSGRQQTTSRGMSTGAHADSNTQQFATLAPHQSYSPETPPSKVVEACSNAVQPPMQAKRNTHSIPGKPASLVGPNATNVPFQVQLPSPAQCPDLGGTCKTAACSGLGLPQAGGLCLDCWSEQEGAASANIQQSQAANSRAQDSSRAPRNNYKEAKRKANLPASRNGGIHTRVPAQHTCTAPGCEGVVDERVHAALCPECFSHLERRNSSPTQSQAGHGGAADSLRSPSTSTSAPSPVQPAVHFAQEPNVQRCVTKGCKRSATRENGFFCSVHAASGNLQQGWSHHQGSTNNTSQQSQSYTQPPSISSSAPISLTFNGTVEQLHVHHHHYPAQNVPQSNGTGGLESQPRSPFSAQEAPQSGLGMRGSESMPWQSNGFPSRMHNNGAAAPVSEYGPVCPKCGKPGNAWFNDLCQKCQQQQQK